MLEEFSSQLAVIATVMGTVMALSYAPQIYKILKRKSVEDLSLSMFILLLLGSVAWLLYGLSTNSYPIMISNSVGVVSMITTITLYFKYKRKR